MYALKNRVFLPVTASSRLGDTSSMAMMDNLILHQDPWQFYSFLALVHSYIPPSFPVLARPYFSSHLTHLISLLFFLGC